MIDFEMPVGLMVQSKAEVIRVNPAVEIPKYATEGSAAVDLQAAIDAPITINPGEKAVLIPTGLKIHHGTPALCSMILPRSGHGHKHGLVLGNLVGLIDSDYQGQLFVSAYVHVGYEPYTIQPLERFAQLAFVHSIQMSFQEVTEFTDKSARGEGGFGSSGKEALAQGQAQVAEAKE
jgi:dUTP pyrophosphatase